MARRFHRIKLPSGVWVICKKLGDLLMINYLSRIQLGLLISLLLSHSAFSFTFDRNVPKKIQEQMTQDLSFIGTLQSNTQSDLHKQIFGSVSGETYSRFFNTRVTGIGLSSCGDSHAVACVIPMFDSSKMWITQNYIKFSHPQIARTMVVYHEARHTEEENGNWPHATCPEPFLDQNGKELKSIWTGATLASQPACDTSAHGSYGSSMIMLKNISKFCTNCTDKVKMDAGLYADDQFNRIIDDQTIQQIKDDLYRS